VGKVESDDEAVVRHGWLMGQLGAGGQGKWAGGLRGP
jgi:hypothetical protein